MRSATFWMFTVLLVAVLISSSSARCACASQKLHLRSTSSSDDDLEPARDPQQIDLNQLSEPQLLQLAQQLDLDLDYDEDHRGTSRPWKKVQRIIKRQLVRIPKRYLKKLLRQFGLARDGSFRSGSAQPEDVAELEPELYYLIPLE